MTVDFTDDGIAAIARVAAEVNAAVENIGARRLQTVMEKLLEEVSFDAEDRRDPVTGGRRLCRPATGGDRAQYRSQPVRFVIGLKTL